EGQGPRWAARSVRGARSRSGPARHERRRRGGASSSRLGRASAGPEEPAVTPRLAAAAAVCVSGAIVVVLVGTALGWWSDGGTATAARPVDVNTSLLPAQSVFGDPL